HVEPGAPGNVFPAFLYHGRNHRTDRIGHGRRGLRNGRRAFPSGQGRGHGAGEPGWAEALEGKFSFLTSRTRPKSLSHRFSVGFTAEYAEVAEKTLHGDRLRPIFLIIFLCVSLRSLRLIFLVFSVPLCLRGEKFSYRSVTLSSISKNSGKEILAD